MKRYILGECSEEESDRLQAAYFDDERFFTTLLGVENDLFDSYVRGELSWAERVQFERRLLVTRGQHQRLAFARLLQHAADARLEAAPKRQGKDSWWRFLTAWLRNIKSAPALALGGALIVVAPSIAWFAIHYRGWRSIEPAHPQQPARPVAQLQPTFEPPAATAEGAGASPARSSVQPQQPERPKTSATAAAVPGQASPNTARINNGSDGTVARRTPRPPRGNAKQPGVANSGVAFLVLNTGLVRDGGEAARLTVTPATRWAELRLELTDTGNRRYRAVLQTAEGVEVFRGSARTARTGKEGRFIDLRIPAKLLTKRDYVVLVHAESPDGVSENVGGYSFSVMRR